MFQLNFVVPETAGTGARITAVPIDRALYNNILITAGSNAILPVGPAPGTLTIYSSNTSALSAAFSAPGCHLFDIVLNVPLTAFDQLVTFAGATLTNEGFTMDPTNAQNEIYAVTLTTTGATFAAAPSSFVASGAVPPLTLATAGSFGAGVWV